MENPLFKLIPDSVDSAAKNLVDPPTKNAGNTLGDIWYLVFGGISQAAEKKRLKYAIDLQKYEQQLKEALDLIPESKKKEADIQVTAQALEASKYCVSTPVLREMFVRLIAGSLNSDLEPHVHPSFPEILKQMSVKDALLLSSLKSTSDLPIINLGLNTEGNAYCLLYKGLLLPCNGLSSQEASVAASALEREGLVSMTMSEQLSNERAYDQFEETQEYLRVKNLSLSQGTSIRVNKGICRLTTLGVEFVQVCV